MMWTHIQLPEPLFKKLRSIAKMKDLSLAEIIRRETEKFADTYPDHTSSAKGW